MTYSKPLTIDYVGGPHPKNKFHLPITVFKKPESEEEYEVLQTLLHRLMDEVGQNEGHPLQLVMQIIGENLESYDDAHSLPIGDGVSHVEMVKHLMAAHGLTQNDLADIFSGQGNVSKFLNGERALSKANIVGLKKMFGVSADFFLRG